MHIKIQIAEEDPSTYSGQVKKEDQYILQITRNIPIFSAEEDKKENEHLHIHPVCCIQCVAAHSFTCVTE